MCNKEKKCRAWISLDSLGLFVQGCLKDTAWFNSLVIPCNHSILNPSVFIDIPENKLICIRNVAHGKFGYIDLAKHIKNTRQEMNQGKKRASCCIIL